jgi:ABC transporter substrate binding protein
VFYGSDGPDGFFRFLSLKCEHRSRVHQISSQCSFIPLLSLVKKRISCPSRPRCPAGFLIVRPTVPSPSETVREIRIRSGPADIRQRTSSEVVCRAGTPQLCQQRPSDHDDTDRDGACRRPSENRSCRQPGPSRWHITGVSLYGSELAGKRVELLQELLPAIARLGSLANAANPATQIWWEETQLAARALGLEGALFTVREPNELTAAFAAMQRNGVDAVVVEPDAMFMSAQRQITTLTIEHQLPAMYESPEFVQDGGLISYGSSITEMTRRSAMFVDKILKGIKPADLPIEQPTKYALVINLKTAKALGLTIPPSLLARADEVIE